MSWVKGRMRKCDKCGKTVFENIKKEHIIETRESDGGWGTSVVGDYQETPGWEVFAGTLDICPDCADYKNVKYTFTNEGMNEDG